MGLCGLPLVDSCLECGTCSGLVAALEGFIGS
jgi:hypothetical protein